MKDQVLEFKREGSLYFLHASQWVPKDIWDLWDFFSIPENLPRITPEFMNFEITSGGELNSYSGQIISYKVNVFPFLRMRWVSEMKNVEPPHFFVDEQLRGPYPMWHHEHRFIPYDGGTIIEDKVSFRLPLGPMHHLIFPTVIKPKLQQIFEHRQEVVDNLYGESTLLRVS